MRTILFIFSSIISICASGQFIPILVTYDNIEFYTWFGAWQNLSNSGYYSNVSVSPTASAAAYGIGGSTSVIEQNTYVLPSVTGLDPTRSHLFKFRLGSYRFTSINSTRGVDIGDYVEVRVSTNGGVTYTSEIRITGFSNAYWSYNTLGIINKTANGALSVFTPSSGGDRSSTGDGYSQIELTIPAGITQIAVDIYCRTNSAGEEWWLDDLELFVLEPDAILPIDLVSFTGVQDGSKIKLEWTTAQETNSSHFVMERSIDGIGWDSILMVESNNSRRGSEYFGIDSRPIAGVNYYRLNQYNIDGLVSTSNTISVEYKFNKIETYVYQNGTIFYIKNCDTYSKFKLIDLYGKVVKEDILTQNSFFETSEISSGIYYLNLIGDQSTTSILKVRIIN